MQLYYWIVQLVKYRTEEAYQKVKEYFKLVVFTDKDEEQEVLVHLLNFCAYAMRKGDFSYGQEILNVYKEAAASNKLNKYLTGQTYLNIVSYACKLKEVAWVASFIDTYSEKLISSEKEDFIILSKARLFIERKEYDQALKILINIKSKLFQIEKKRRDLQIKCLIELNIFYFI